MDTGATKTYICSGTCGAHITEEEYNNGLTACGTEGCTMKGHTFVEENPSDHSAHDVVKSDDEDVVINN